MAKRLSSKYSVHRQQEEDECTWAISGTHPGKNEHTLLIFVKIWQQPAFNEEDVSLLYTTESPQRSIDIIARANYGGSTRGKNGDKTLTCCQE